TAPDGSIRDGNRAVELGERAQQLSGGQDPWILGTVAAAYAEAGRFSNAVAIIRQAMTLASAQTNREHVALFQTHPAPYEKGIPISDNPVVTPLGTNGSK